MCLITRSKYGHILKKDMIVYKYFILLIKELPKTKDKQFLLKTPYRQIKVPDHTPFDMHSSIRGRVKLACIYPDNPHSPVRYRCEGEGVHAYAKKNQLRTSLVEYENDDCERCLKVKVQAECVIPKGTRIYENVFIKKDNSCYKDNDIAAQKIRILRFFLFSKTLTNKDFAVIWNFASECISKYINPVIKQINKKENVSDNK